MVLNNSLIRWALEKVIETVVKKQFCTDISIDLDDINIKSENGKTRLHVKASVEGADDVIKEIISRKLQAL